MQKDDPKVEKKKTNYKRVPLTTPFCIIVLFRLVSKWELTSISFMYPKISRIVTSLPDVYVPEWYIVYFYFW